MVKMIMKIGLYFSLLISNLYSASIAGEYQNDNAKLEINKDLSFSYFNVNKDNGRTCSIMNEKFKIEGNNLVWNSNETDCKISLTNMNNDSVNLNISEYGCNLYYCGMGVEIEEGVYTKGKNNSLPKEPDTKTRYGFKGFYLGDNYEESCNKLENILKNDFPESKYNKKIVNMFNSNIISCGDYKYMYLTPGKDLQTIVKIDVDPEFFGYKSGVKIEKFAQDLMNALDWIDGFDVERITYKNEQFTTLTKKDAENGFILTISTSPFGLDITLIQIEKEKYSF
ncbi:hypothetical protein [Aliarcobacter cryaerophilus]|uniref:hypothetical protein n=1 Tax=Aliarcobacter cryaerophilus TaxID=28198 RepID=UPI0021B5D36F|nr:hypothetical protein [Aliarcobacter cryaerophilus]MCT7530546.1 hypothetical protein [Aliarcobacter cryaerophilus]